MYALLTLEAACLLSFLSRLLTERRPSTGCWVGLAASQAAVMLTHNAAAVYFPLALNAAMGRSACVRVQRAPIMLQPTGTVSSAVG